MSTTVEAIYEHGIFRPVSSVPATLKEHERVRITIDLDVDDEKALFTEFAEWDAASNEDINKIEKRLEEIG